MLAPDLKERIKELTGQQLNAFSAIPDVEVPILFERALSENLSGKQIKDAIANRDGEITHVLFHDTRRTAIRNMERASVRRTDARQISGHLTESVYQRYDIGSEQGAFEAAERLRKFHVEQQSKKIVGNLWDEGPESNTEADEIIGAKSLN